MFEPSPLSDVDASPPAAPDRARRPPLGTVERPRAGLTRVYDYPAFDRSDHKGRLDKLSAIADAAADDPRLRRLCVSIFRAANVQARDYRGQAAAIHAFLRDNVYFLNEKDEVLQDPIYTLDLQADGTVGPRAHGDCDDFCTTFVALCRTCHLPAEPVISGRDARGNLHRFVRGMKKPAVKVGYTHAYSIVGPHPFRNKKPGKGWLYADPTVAGVALGWDCVSFGLSDPQRGASSADLGELLGDPGDVDGLSLKAAGQLVIVTVVASLLADTLRQTVFRS